MPYGENGRICKVRLANRHGVQMYAIAGGYYPPLREKYEDGRISNRSNRKKIKIANKYPPKP
ncbi:MAG: hypothetical protein FWG65_06555 [Turicibacter sp.]|nr:hypothetical protein [Turicibacter sp.]